MGDRRRRAPQNSGRRMDGERALGKEGGAVVGTERGGEEAEQALGAEGTEGTWKGLCARGRDSF